MREIKSVKICLWIYECYADDKNSHSNSSKQHNECYKVRKEIAQMLKTTKHTEASNKYHSDREIIKLSILLSFFVLASVVNIELNYCTLACTVFRDMNLLLCVEVISNFHKFQTTMMKFYWTSLHFWNYETLSEFPTHLNSFSYIKIYENLCL